MNCDLNEVLTGIFTPISIFTAAWSCSDRGPRVQRMVFAGIPSGQRESSVLRTFLAAFASVAFDPCQPSLAKEHNPPNMDLNKQCNP